MCLQNKHSIQEPFPVKVASLLLTYIAFKLFRRWRPRS